MAPFGLALLRIITYLLGNGLKVRLIYTAEMKNKLSISIGPKITLQTDDLSETQRKVLQDEGLDIETSKNPKTTQDITDSSKHKQDIENMRG